MSVGDKQSSSLPTAKEAMQKLAAAEAQRATEEHRRQMAVEEEKKSLIDKLSQPSGVSDEEAITRVIAIIERAVQNGLTEIQVYRFPNSLCTDRGRAINQQEAGWENTLTGIPKEIFEFWKRQLRPQGYKIKSQIVEFPDGVPGDVGLILKWS
jgi:hypothetical protein